MRETLYKGLPALGLDTGLVPQLELFAGILLEKNQVMNLTAITEPKDVAALHLLDSLALTAWLKDERVVDVGTGAGFPGIPLAAALPEAKFTLLDSLGKRVGFLRVSWDWRMWSACRRERKSLLGSVGRFLIVR